MSPETPPYLNDTADLDDLHGLWLSQAVNYQDKVYIWPEELKKYQLLEDLHTGVVCVYDVIRAEFPYFSERIEQLSGLPKEAFIGTDYLQTFSRYVHPDDQPEIIVNGQLAFYNLQRLPDSQKLRYVYSMTFRFLFVPDTYRWVYFLCRPIRLDANGAVRYVLVQIMDIHAHHTSELFTTSQETWDDSGKKIVLNHQKPIPAVRLSSREREVLELLARGCSTPEIANKLGVKPTTVTEFRRRLLKKTNTTNTAELIAYSTINDLI
jgi:DNA-binding CsgD family transcriptional regulator